MLSQPSKKFLSTLLIFPLLASSKIIYAGVNEAGGEFSQCKIPGAFGTDYEFINKSHVQTFLKQGANMFRIPFLMERMVPVQYGLGPKFNETYFSEYAAAVNYITTRNAYALIDPHNYMRYGNSCATPFGGPVIGNTSDSSAATTAQFASFWAELATRFLYNPNVILGIMNEPHDMPTELIFRNDQAALSAIRSVGANQLVLVPGNGYTHSETWNASSGTGLLNGSTPSADVLGNIYDPLGNFAFDMHTYFDKHASGEAATCVVGADAGERLLGSATAWLAANNFTAFFSEFGAAGNSSMCDAAVNSTVQWLSSHEQFIGWTYWAAGPQWGDYFMSVEPTEGPGYNTTWLEILAPAVKGYKGLKSFGISNKVT